MQPTILASALIFNAMKKESMSEGGRKGGSSGGTSGTKDRGCAENAVINCSKSDNAPGILQQIKYSVSVKLDAPSRGRTR